MTGGGSGPWVPGRAVIRLASLLVPWAHRWSWSQEWLAELEYGYASRLESGGAPWISAAKVIRRSMGAVPDAWWMRRRHGGGWMIGQEVWYALRGLRRRPGFALAMVATLALGIGGTTAIYSVVDPVLMRSLPYEASERVVELWQPDEKGNPSLPFLDREVWSAWEGAVPYAERVAAHAEASFVTTGIPNPERTYAEQVTGGFFAMLGARPLRGRLLTPSDVAPGAPDVVVVSESFWRSALGSAEGAIGGEVRLGDRPYTIVGVAPKTFKYPLGTVHMWLPLKEPSVWGAERIVPVVRLREGVSLETVRTQFAARTARLERELPREGGWGATPRPIEERFANADVRAALLLLAGTVACVLLIACANAANLLLVQAAGRWRELAVRRALGGSRGRIVRQLLVETLVLTSIGGAIGVALAYAGVAALRPLLPDMLTLYSLATVGVDGRALVFASVVTVATGLLFGVGPALRASRGASVSGERGGTGTRGLRRTRSALVVAELALAVLLLVGAGLLLRSFARLTAVDPGFDIERLAAGTVELSEARYPDEAARDAFWSALRRRLQAMPGVDGVAITEGLPPSAGFSFGIEPETADGGAVAWDPMHLLPRAVVDTSYFRVLGIPIVDGRSFGPQDVRGGETAVIIDPDLAALLWPGERAVGRRFRIAADAPWWTVVGVSGDVKLHGPNDAQRRYAVYFSATQRPMSDYRWVVVRGRRGDAALAALIRDAVRAMDPDQPIGELAPATRLYAAELRQPVFVLLLMGIFAGIAVTLAAIGVYGVIAYGVAQRTREIGVRVALGARRGDVVRLVVGDTAVLVGTGVALGIGAALALSRYLRVLLFQVAPDDPATMVAVMALIAAIALAASWLPARRAARLSPVEALRIE